MHMMGVFVCVCVSVRVRVRCAACWKSNHGHSLFQKLASCFNTRVGLEKQRNNVFAKTAGRANHKHATSPTYSTSSIGNSLTTYTHTHTHTHTQVYIHSQRQTAGTLILQAPYPHVSQPCTRTHTRATRSLAPSRTPLASRMHNCYTPYSSHPKTKLEHGNANCSSLIQFSSLVAPQYLPPSLTVPCCSLLFLIVPY